MFFYKNDKGTYAKVWEISERKDKYTDFRFSTSEKLEDGTYKNSNWNGRLVGHAFNAIPKLEPGQRIIIKSAKITNEAYKNQDGQNRSYLRVVIFEAAVADADGAQATSTAPKTKKAEPASTDDDELPF